MALLIESEVRVADISGKSLPPNTIPAYAEFDSEEDTSPYLVTGSHSPYLWVHNHRKDNKIRAGIRTRGWDTRDKDIALKLLEKCLDLRLVFSSLEEATESFIMDGFVREDIELLRSPSYEDDTIAEEMWVPEGYAVVLPKDRSYLGWCVRITDRDNSYSAVVHNPIWGIRFVNASLDGKSEVDSEP